MSAIFVTVYTIWAWAPDSVLNGFGWYYWPNKYYVVAIPNWIGVTALCYFICQDALNLLKSHPRHSYFTLQDKFTKLTQPRQRIGEPKEKEKVQTRKFKEKNEKVVEKEVKKKFGGGLISEIQDLPVTVVNNVLYSKYMGQSYFD